MKLRDTLEARGNIYGDYVGNLEVRSKLMDAILTRYYDVNNATMDPNDAELFRDVVAKLARLAVTPRHKDSWHDVAGYASLVDNMLENAETKPLPGMEIWK